MASPPHVFAVWAIAPLPHGLGYPRGYIHMDIHGVGYPHRGATSVRSNLAKGRIAPRSRLCTLPIGPLYNERRHFPPPVLKSAPSRGDPDAHLIKIKFLGLASLFRKGHVDLSSRFCFCAAHPSAQLLCTCCCQSSQIQSHHCHPSTSSSLRITDRSFQYASPRLWNQLPASRRQLRTNLSNSDSPSPMSGTSSISSINSPLSSSITRSFFHLGLKPSSSNPSHRSLPFLLLLLLRWRKCH